MAPAPLRRAEGDQSGLRESSSTITGSRQSLAGRGSPCDGPSAWCPHPFVAKTAESAAPQGLRRVPAHPLVESLHLSEEVPSRLSGSARGRRTARLADLRGEPEASDNGEEVERCPGGRLPLPLLHARRLPNRARSGYGTRTRGAPVRAHPGMHGARRCAADDTAAESRESAPMLRHVRTIGRAWPVIERAQAPASRRRGTTVPLPATVADMAAASAASRACAVCW